MPLAQLLVDLGVISAAQAAEAHRHRSIAGGTLPDVLARLGFVQRRELQKILEEPPKAPQSVEETGLEPRFLLHLLLKTLYVTGLETPSALGDHMRLHAAIADTLLREAKDKRLAAVLGTEGRMSGELRYELTDLGRKWALDSLEESRYVGPAPVRLDDYHAQVMKQSLDCEVVSRGALDRAVSHLVLPPHTVRRLGPAVNSGKSILLYGPSGNGKTSLAEAIGNAFHSTIYVPYCVEADRQIITVYDPSLHQPPEDASEAAAAPETRGRNGQIDPRWVRCHRPVVITGGELNMEMLDLIHDPVSNYYEAPAHMKAAGGVFIIDDFGRQRVPPQDILNRWILPLDRRVDYLTLRTGKKLRFPFDQLVVFSTNIDPAELMDEAALRRVQYKFHLAPPTDDDYEEILRRVCQAHDLKPPSRELLDYLLRTFYPETGTRPSAYHPRFIVEHVIASCDFYETAPELTVDLAREALANLVLKSVPPKD